MQFLRVMLAISTAGLAAAANYYVAPTGSASGDGSITKPWNFATALKASTIVKPGDTIWMRAGVHKMVNPAEFWSTLSGTATAPIIIRNYPGESPVVDLSNLDSALYVYGSNTWFWGLEIMSSNIPRSTSLTGPWAILASTIDVRGPGTKFINCYIHDISNGLSFWNESIASEAYGNIVYHVGWSAPDRGHGHAIYSQNQPSTGPRKAFSENFLGEAFDIGLQLYGGGTALVQDYYVAGNVIWNNGLPAGQNVDQLVIAGGGVSKRNIEVDTNFVFNSGNTGYSRIGWQWDTRNGDVNIHGNWFIGGYTALEVWRWDQVTFRNNYLHQPRQSSGAGLSLHPRRASSLCL